MTGKEAFEDAIDYCDFMYRMIDRQQRKKDAMLKGKLQGIEIIKAGLIQKRDREEERENVQT